MHLTLASQPTGAGVTFNSESGAAPLTHEVIARSRNSIGATSPQTIGGQNYLFESWSDGGASSHDVTAPDADTTLTARLRAVTTATFSPQADARVEKANTSTNYGTSNYMRTVAAPDPDVESYLRFQLSGIAGTVQSAKLRLYDVNNATVDGPAAYGTSSSWTETGINWSNRPARTSGPFDDKGAIAANSFVEWDVKPLVTGNGAVSIALAQTSADGTNFSSREDSTTTRRPQLIVTYTPQTDAAAPTPPTLTGQATSATRVDLSWSGAGDDIGVTGYEVYRGTALVATLGAVAGWSDTTVAPSTPYSYTVKALDAAGNRSAPSNAVNVITPAAPASTTVTFAPDADARVEEITPSTNFGASTRLKAEDATDPGIESFLRFQLTGLVGQVQSATLRLFDHDDSTVDGPAVYSASSSWTESAVTWANKPARSGLPSDDKGALTKATFVDFNVKPLVTGNGALTLSLVSVSNDSASFASREYADTTVRPQLIVTYGG